jgi:hypothetical protein
MAKLDYVKPWVERSLRQGIGPTEALRIAREGGLQVRTQDWFRAYGQERANIAMSIQARDLPLNRRPAANEIGTWTTVRKRGFAQRVTVLTQDTLTGATKQRYVTVTTRSLVSRGNAIKQAMAAFVDNEDNYDTQVIAAFSAGVFEMIPGDEGEGEG